MNLQNRLQSFLDWMHSHTVPGFREYTDETYSEDFITVTDVMNHIAAKMKTAIQTGDFDGYIRNEDQYREYFNAANEELSREHYCELWEDLANQGLDAESAQIMAVDELWKSKPYLYHLDVAVRMINKETGEYLYLVGTSEHAHSGRNPYITSSEVNQLKASFKDPWEYVRNREVNNVQTGTYG